MSSIFPDRSLSRVNSQEVAVITGLTDSQKKQVQSITDNYMRVRGLVGYENRVSAMPVIKHCIEKGLLETQGREAITPEDNLTLAFTKGYEPRSALLSRVQAAFGNNIGDKFEGNLALPGDIVEASKREIRQETFKISLKTVEALDKLIQIRTPVFNSLLEYSRNRVEEQIQGSRDVALTPKQEAGLIRNLIFSYISFGNPRLILETEDFMNSKESYLKMLSVGAEGLLKELAEITGLSSEEGLGYLHDLAQQISDYLDPVPSKPEKGTSELEVGLALDKAFRALDRNFLVVNPFPKYSPLSENPEDEGRSIWDEGRSRVLEIDGVRYRIPTSATLQLAAILIESVSSQRASQLSQGAKYVENLLYALARDPEDRNLKTLETEVQSAKEDLANVKYTIASGEVPKAIAMNKTDAIRLIDRQMSTMRREETYLRIIRDYHRDLLNLGVKLFLRYINGEPIIGVIAGNNLREFTNSPLTLRARVRGYLRDRIKGRFQTVEEAFIYQEFASAMQAQTEFDPGKEKFSQAFESTVLDIVRGRNRFWLNLYFQDNSIIDENKTAVGRAILSLEEQKIMAALREKAKNMAVSSDSEAADLELHKMLANPNYPLTILLNEIRIAKTSLWLSPVLAPNRLFGQYLEGWKKEGDRKIRTAIHSWDASTTITLLKEEIQRSMAMGHTRSLKPKGDEDTTKATRSALKMVVGTLARLAPASVWLEEEFSLQSFTHQPEPDWSDLMSNPNTGYRRDELLERFKNWLQEETGVYFINDETFRSLLEAEDVREMRQGAFWFSQLFNLQDDLFEWFHIQSNKLANQESNYAGQYYNSPPLHLTVSLESNIKQKQARFERAKSPDLGHLN